MIPLNDDIMHTLETCRAATLALNQTTRFIVLSGQCYPIHPAADCGFAPYRVTSLDLKQQEEGLILYEGPLLTRCIGACAAISTCERARFVDTFKCRQLDDGYDVDAIVRRRAETRLAPVLGQTTSLETCYQLCDAEPTCENFDVQESQCVMVNKDPSAYPVRYMKRSFTASAFWRDAYIVMKNVCTHTPGCTHIALLETGAQQTVSSCDDWKTTLITPTSSCDAFSTEVPEYTVVIGTNPHAVEISAYDHCPYRQAISTLDTKYGTIDACRSCIKINQILQRGQWELSRRPFRPSEISDTQCPVGRVRSLNDTRTGCQVCTAGRKSDASRSSA